ncbi:MAG TPA: multifunctional oxoglutarate decarboxylase/oxoglutarate dehydrogenase thiamine pyrophosphate-binding subunit/dihydrolipoyllysine-residue succinyltransferase subunit [Candidatus Rubrimentiphilum sp.]|nr:multifunctional oxoglutarate decarboxylase/oxoglutarate dehydrogenase thiamine pyrophosphate-binding subunit/dihydrolipoyllysine-residue succinyltransferase subunit [Candidatus Rubrimentiphilum sp.]
MPDTLVRIVLPEMGESVTEGSVVAWRKQPGDFIAEGDPLVEITTDKVDVEVPATVSGVVKQLLVAEGDSVAIGAPLAEIDTTAKAPDASKAAPAPAPGAAKSTPPKPRAPAAAPPAQTKPNGAVVATPQAKRIARQLDVDLSRVRGSGPDGLILREDVDRQAESLPPASRGAQLPPLPPLPSGAQITPIKGPAAALASYMEQSLSIPTATSFRTIAVDALDARRRELNAGLKAAGRSEKISFTHVIAYALVRAAHEMPFITAHFRRDGNQPVRVEPGIHLGLAVDAERKDGTRFLVVPVIKDASSLDFAAFRNAYEDLVAKARSNKLAADDLQGASFTLTNPGGIGTSASVPRLMPGQGAIIAAGAIGYPPGFAKANEASLKSLGMTKIMQMTSTYDHRVIQGAQSGDYLKRIDQLLQGKDGFYETLFASLGLKPGETEAPGAERPAVAVSDEMLRAVAAGMALVAAYRTHGHLAAHLDPLGSPPPGDPSLEPANWGLTPALQSAVPASVLRVKVPGNTLAEVLPQLRETYSSTIAYEVEHISNTEQREWLRDAIESGRYKITFSDDRKIDLLRRLTRVESFERYVRKTFLGQKTFSLEGLDAMVPMLEELLALIAADGTQTAVIGMAHRGRLNTIAHILNRPYEEILTEFEAAHERGELGSADVTGDVKYHQGAEGVFETPDGRKVRVTLSNNPSHLEAVDPIVEGTARALQTDHSMPVAQLDAKKAVPILIHGDAAFPGQGVVAEVLNLQSLSGYSTGGTIHIISNNQIGFTTDPRDARSTRYASDLAKGFDVPIVHVNADDLNACMWAIHLAAEFRRRFGRDVVIDVIGYRRFGHNEQDEPAYTQPAMAEKIKAHPTARELFANNLVARGVLSPERVAELADDAIAHLQETHRTVKSGKHNVAGMLAKISGTAPIEAVPLAPAGKDRLLAWTEELTRVPEGFTANKKLQAQFERRQATIAQKGLVDWGMAEALAFASLLTQGTPVRLTGQDTERGTFSHRHAVLHDPVARTEYVPLQHLDGAKASFEIYDSPLSEYACLGFEYGYSATIQKALVLWEAQFGDFNNGAQIVIDQFIAAGQAKWGQTARLTLLLPHGYEGMGPEHSSARLERFLQLTAEGNLRVANPSNAANYYHLLRQQATMPQPVALIVMTPKSLLRQEAAAGSLDEMANGEFRPVLDDPRVEDKSKIERLLLCSGKIYYDLTLHEKYKDLKKTAIVRIELLSPLPYTEINAIIATYPNLKKLIWVQEEPKNMGARAYVRRRLLERRTDKLEIDYIGRPYRASPSEGYPGAHAAAQERIVAEALSE